MRKASKKIAKAKESSDEPKEMKKENRGKPSSLKEITLQKPDIWTNAMNGVCLQLVALLQTTGRHCCLHLAGKKGKKDSENEKAKLDSKQKVNQEKEYFECAEEISKKFFNNASSTTRCIVFFFRKPGSPKFDQSEESLKVKDEYKNILKYVLCLLDPDFIQELVFILQDKSIETIVDELLVASTQIESLTSPKPLSEFPQILKNAFITYILEDMITCQINYQNYENFDEIIAEKFYQFLGHSARTEFRKFISEIRGIMNSGENSCDHKYYEDNFQNARIGEECITFECDQVDFQNINLDQNYQEL